MILCCSCPAFAEVGSFVVSDDEEEAAPDLSRQARALMRLMTDNEKIGQLFFVSLEDLTGDERSVALIDGTALSRLVAGGRGARFPGGWGRAGRRRARAA